MPETKGKRRSDRNVWRETAVAAAGMCGFALFVHCEFPTVLLSLLGLSTAAIVILRFVHTESLPLRIVGLASVSSKVGLCTIACTVIAVGLAVAYRWTSGLPLLPSALRTFAVTSALIGISEELVYRGYIQGRLGSMGTASAVVFASLYHTAYKCSLFAFPPLEIRMDFPFFVAATFLGGVLFGLFRAVSGSVLPSAAAHAVFDILVYGELPEAPWWVWG